MYLSYSVSIYSYLFVNNCSLETILYSSYVLTKCPQLCVLVTVLGWGLNTFYLLLLPSEDNLLIQLILELNEEQLKQIVNSTHVI